MASHHGSHDEHPICSRYALALHSTTSGWYPHQQNHGKTAFSLPILFCSLSVPRKSSSAHSKLFTVPTNVISLTGACSLWPDEMHVSRSLPYFLLLANPWLPVLPFAEAAANPIPNPEPIGDFAAKPAGLPQMGMIRDKITQLEREAQEKTWAKISEQGMKLREKKVRFEPHERTPSSDRAEGRSPRTGRTGSILRKPSSDEPPVGITRQMGSKLHSGKPKNRGSGKSCVSIVPR